jgi:CDP-glucose 4,6-dehydratase
MFNDVYRNKKVLITGNTGFKGSWLTTWLLKLGAQVGGYSISTPTVPSIFEGGGLAGRIEHFVGDVQDLGRFRSVLETFKPDFLFHLAAQPVVSISYQEPLSTIGTNVMGTSIVLEALRVVNPECTAVIITSDKCYENVEWVWGYRETDPVGGRDIYSGSKGAAEVIFHAYFHSFFRAKGCRVKIATGRAGNVIGGGDWAKDRIVADCMRSWSRGESVEIRSPDATRPWQHVLEPLSGYLTLAQHMFETGKVGGESFNFGPRAEQNHTVLELLRDLSGYWDFGNPSDAYRVVDSVPFHEAGLLKLNCDKALFHLHWEPSLHYSECVRIVSHWYYSYYRKKIDVFGLTSEQIDEYTDLAKERGRVWTK